jgi:hypothetical protein
MPEDRLRFQAKHGDVANAVELPGDRRVKPT